MKRLERVDAIAPNSNRGRAGPGVLGLGDAAAFAYQRIAREAVGLHSLGMSAIAIARVLKVTDKTIAKAIRLRRLEYVTDQTARPRQG